MANITGTNGNDTLTSTGADDIIKGLGGNDTIIGSFGSDTIDGGAGNDTADYTKLTTGKGIALFIDGLTESWTAYKNDSYDLDKLVNIETVIGNGKGDKNDLVFQNIQTIDADLSTSRFTYSTPSGTKTVTLKKFPDVSAGFNSGFKYGQIKGDDFDNDLKINNGTLIGSKGNDFLLGNTIDYSNIGRAVKIVLTSIGGIRGSKVVNVGVDKNGFGIDTTLTNRIIGTTNKKNTIDASKADFARVDIDLSKNYLNIIGVAVGVVNFVNSGNGNNGSGLFDVVNFVNAVGTKNNDTIVGANKNSKLTGGGGNDKITGGNKNDIITGTDATARGVGEVDTLTGGGGKDKFVLGDKNGAYYVGKGNNDYALITDFDLFKDSISIGSLKNYSFALEGKNTIDLYSGKDVKTRDLIAKIQISGGISSVASNAKSAMSPDASLNALVGKINIISA